MKIQNKILKMFNKILPHRIRSDLCSENTKFYDSELTKVKSEPESPETI